MDEYVLGYVVTQTIGNLKPKIISRVFHVREAADQFAELAKKAGKPGYIHAEEKLGLDKNGTVTID